MKAKTVGSDQVLGSLLNDPTTLSQEASVPAIADAGAFASLFGLLTQSIGKLLNSGGTYDTQRSAAGTVGVPAIEIEGTKATYSSGTISFVPVATPTDFAGLIGSATKTVRLKRIVVSGFATAAISEALQLIKRTTANSGSTPADIGIAQHDSNDPGPTAIFRTYTTTNPTTGTGGGTLRAEKLNQGVTGAAGKVTWEFGDKGSKALVLRGVAQAAMLNWNGAAVPAGTSLDMYVEWTEE